MTLKEQMSEFSKGQRQMPGERGVLVQQGQARGCGKLAHSGPSLGIRPRPLLLGLLEFKFLHALS